ncbi:MAG TPA: FG-GAP-like repeat-containing protein, partial [Gemmataceae bacterium]|nr:FG-GAP-like repeat-containing protein [Gemmataceae bacterium]
VASPLLKVSGERLAFVTSFSGTADLGAGPLTTAGNESDTALGFLDAAGKTVWAKALGGPSSPTALAVDRQGNLFVLASTNADLRVGDRSIRIDACYKAGAVLASFSGDGGVRWARGWGLSSWGAASGWIAVDHAGSVLVGGNLQEIGGAIRWEGNPREIARTAEAEGTGHWESYVLTFSSDGRPGQGVFGNWALGTLSRPAIDRRGASFVLGSLPSELPPERLGADFSLQLKVGNVAILRVAPASKIEERGRDEERADARRFPWLVRRPAWATSPPGRAKIDFGQSLAYLGDVDGDHLGDVAIGAPRAGGAWIYFGGAKGFRKSATALRPPPGVRKGFGERVTALGDLNADGRPDLAVFSGEPAEPGGRLAVYFGAAGGPSPSPGWVMPPLKTKETPAAVVAADLDGDGAPELIVGVPQVRKGRGRVLIYRGGPTGPSTTPAWTLDGPKSEASFGAALAFCDVNHDGIADLIVGAPGAEPEEGGPDAGRTGAVYLYLGGKSGLSQTSAWSYQSHAEWFGLGAALACPGDVDGDGKPDLVVAHPWSEIDGGDIWSGQVHLFPGTGSGFSKEPTWSVDIGTRSATIVPAGDVNGDGLADFLVGASPGSPEADSRVDLYLGGRSGPARVADWVIRRWDAGFGSAVASGDVNGDGVRDVLIGDPEHQVCVRHPNIGKAPVEVEMTTHGQVEVYLGHR